MTVQKCDKYTRQLGYTLMTGVLPTQRAQRERRTHVHTARHVQEDPPASGRLEQVRRPARLRERHHTRRVPGRSVGLSIDQFVTSPPVGEENYCADRVSGCLSVCPRAYLQYYMSDLHEFVMHVTHIRIPWLGLPLAALRYVMYFRFMDDVIFAYDEPYAGVPV